MIYLVLKAIHILGATVLLGTGIGIAFFAWFGYRRARRADSIELLRGVLALTVVADSVFTATAAIVQPVTGAALWYLTVNDWTNPWIWLVIALYVGVGVCWIPVVAIQIRLRDAAAAAPAMGALEPDFHRRFRVWFALGVPAFVMMVALVLVMVFRGYWM